MNTRASLLLLLLATAVTLPAQSLTWTARDARTDPQLQITGIAYGAGRFVAVGYGAAAGSFSQSTTSTDGITWTPGSIPVPANGVVRSVAFGNGLFAATLELNGGATSPSRIFTSPDGLAWTPRTTGDGNLWAITYGNGRFVAVGGRDTSNNIVTSTDGVTWTRISNSGTTAGLWSVGFGNGLFVAGGEGGAIVTSPDGTTWTARPAVAGAGNLEAVTYAASRWTAVGGSGVFSSTDGLAWSRVATLPTVLEAFDLAYDGATYVVAADNIDFNTFAQTGRVFTSGNGTTFTGANLGTSSLKSVAVGGGIWVLGGNNKSLYTSPSTGGSGGGSGGGTPAPAGIAFLGNLSVRARAGSGSETLIVGVTIGGGATTAPKSVLIRGIGPALSTFGVSGTLPDPVLTLLSGTSTVAANDDWMNDASLVNTSAAVGAFGLTAGSRDAALLTNAMTSGGYTVQLTGKAGATGNALIELYDTAPAASVTTATARFTNLSARTFGGTGNDTLIVGLNVAGTGSRRLLIRAVGPGLGAFGVTGTMPDPKLELFSGATKLAENDNWEASTLAAQQGVGAFALTAGSRDAVLVSTLNPGGYTVQVTGGTTGVVLVEAYELP